MICRCGMYNLVENESSSRLNGIGGSRALEMEEYFLERGIGLGSQTEDRSKIVEELYRGSMRAGVCSGLGSRWS